MGLKSGLPITIRPTAGALQVKDTDRRIIRKRNARVTRRLANKLRPGDGDRPVLSGRLPRYEMSDRVTATRAGGVGAIHALVRRLGLPEAIDDRLHLLKRHLPYHESDHVLALAYNVLAGGTCLQDLDHLREDEALMNMLGARRLPDPTTAGDFLRRFARRDIEKLQSLVNEKRVEVWTRQPRAFLERAVIDVDGTVAETQGEKKFDMDFNHQKKVWGYHPLLTSLANSREPLFLVNRPGNVQSHQGSAEVIDQAIDLVSPVFGSVLVRGDTDFSLTTNFDRWSAQGVAFVFGFDAKPNLVALAEEVPASKWKRFRRPPRYEVETQPRRKRPPVREELVEQKGWKNLVLKAEHITEFAYQPGKCRRPYRMIVLRKKIDEKRGQKVLFEQHRYFFYVTNDEEMTAEEVVRESNERCDQENLIGQLKSGIEALRLPVHDLVSNWAYMVIASLAWTFKAWFGLTLPRSQDRLEIVRMEFRRFLQTVVLIPAQVLQSGRRTITRLLTVTPLIRLLFRSMQATRTLT
jgi:hypothetical protein